jgi:hypothetical protein
MRMVRGTAVPHLSVPECLPWARRASQGCDRSIPTPLCRQWLLLSGLDRVDTSDGKRLRGEGPPMHVIPDTTQPNHTQVHDDVPTRNRPRHSRAFEPLRQDDLARGLRKARPARELLALGALRAHPLRARFDGAIGVIGELGLATEPPTPPQRRGGLSAPSHSSDLGLEHMAHLCGPVLRLVARADNRVGSLLHVPARMGEIDAPSPRPTPPGTAWGHPLVANLLVIGAWLMARIAARGEAQELPIDLLDNRLEQARELIGAGGLPGCGPQPQGNRPHALAPAVKHGYWGCGSLLRHAPTQRHTDAVASNRPRRPQAPRGGAGLCDPAQDPCNVGAFSIGGHPRTQTPQECAKGGARPGNAVVSLTHLQDLVWGVVGGPGAHALGESRGSPARLDAQPPLPGMEGAAVVPMRFVEPTPEGPRPQERAHDRRMVAATARETALQRHPRRGLTVRFGLEAMERPRHDPAPSLAQHCAELPCEEHRRWRRWLVVETRLKEPHATGKRARQLSHERLTCRGQQHLGWRRMDQRGAPGSRHDGH